jgi:hypothetical protein
VKSATKSARGLFGTQLKKQKLGRPKRPKRGRPPKAPGTKYMTKIRFVGRVTDQDWEIVLENYARSGEKTFTAFARERLMKRARTKKQG